MGCIVVDDLGNDEIAGGTSRLFTATTMTEISSFAFRLAPSQVNWSESHAKTLSKDYPFTDIANETPDMYVQRTYLQFLWLPEVCSSFILCEAKP